MVVPNSVLSTDAGVVRVTAPGRKECEGAADSPGDGLPLTAVHPGLHADQPAARRGFQPKVTGMDWLPDGRLVICTWGGSDQSGTSQAGEVCILGNTGGATAPGQRDDRRIAEQPEGADGPEGRRRRRLRRRRSSG